MLGILVLAAVGLASRVNRRMDLPKNRPGFVVHLHPPRIPAVQSRFWYTLGTGGLAVFLSLVLLLTGLLEMFYYVPSPEQAAISVSIIKTLVPFGNLVRNLHFWSAQFLVIVMSLHLLRVVLTGAYAPPRRFNYLIGLGLLVLILLLDFTGYVLRWDEGVHWALVVGTNLLKTIPLIGDGLYRFVMGGGGPGPATLIRFYAWHIFGLTLAVIILVTWHAFRVRRDGGIASAPPDLSQDPQWITRFDLVRREVLAMVIGIILLIVVSLVIPAPTDLPISSFSRMTGSSQAPWFFLWVQQLLKWGDPFWLGIMIPVVVVTLLGLFPYILPNADKNELGRWLPRGNRAGSSADCFTLPCHSCADISGRTFFNRLTMKNDLSRRDFIKLSTRTLLGLGAILGLGGLVRYFSFEPDQGPPSVFDLGMPAAFRKGRARIRGEVPAVIINQDGMLKAISLICTHLGCTIEENKENGGGFTCPCHGSAFDENGKVLNGPAQEPLRSLRVEITGENKVMVYTE